MAAEDGCLILEWCLFKRQVKRLGLVGLLTTRGSLRPTHLKLENDETERNCRQPNNPQRLQGL